MGRSIEPTWPADADRTRTVLGAALATLLEDEDTVVPILARQLGVVWPEDPLDFEVALSDATGRGAPLSCDPSYSALPRRLVLGRSGEPPASFFACVLSRSFVRLDSASALRKALSSSPTVDAPHLYGCIVGVAIVALRVAGAEGAKQARAIEADARLSDVCSPRELEWVSREWLKRVREDETPAVFGARASAELAHEVQ